VQLSSFWLVIIALVIFRLEGWEEMESKDVKGKGKNKEVGKKKTEQRNKKSFKGKNRERQCTNEP
jgi:hypothetical protein